MFTAEFRRSPFVISLGGLMALAVVRQLHERRAAASPDEIAAFETDVFSGFVLARASAGLSDSTIRGDAGHIEQIRAWFGRPLWEMQPPDADRYFGAALRGKSKGTHLARAQALSTYFEFLDLRFRAEVYAVMGRPVESPLDEMNRPRGRKEMALRIPPGEREVEALFSGWRSDLVTFRKFGPTARSYAAMRYADAARRLLTNEPDQDFPADGGRPDRGM
jgi:hypothetical protein